jgi:hypothetical protein
MKVKRSYLVLSLCFLLLASGLGLVVVVVSLSPSLGGNSTQVFAPENIPGGCVNCTLLVSAAGRTNHLSISVFSLLLSIAAGMCFLEFLFNIPQTSLSTMPWGSQTLRQTRQPGLCESWKSYLILFDHPFASNRILSRHDSESALALFVTKVIQAGYHDLRSHHHTTVHTCTFLQNSTFQTIKAASNVNQPQSYICLFFSTPSLVCSELLVALRTPTTERGICPIRRKGRGSAILAEERVVYWIEAFP